MSKPGRNVGRLSSRSIKIRYLRCRCQNQAVLWVDFQVVSLKSEVFIAGVKTRQHCGSTFELYRENQKISSPVSKPDGIVGQFWVVPLKKKKDGKKQKHRRRQFLPHWKSFKIIWTQNFLNECEVNEILSNKSNWLNKHKYINTNSYYSAMKIYFPLIKQNNCNKLSTKYMKTQQERQLLEDCRYYK